MKLEHTEVKKRIEEAMNIEWAGGADYKLGVEVGLAKAIDIILAMVTENVAAGMNPPE